jgi:branched-chain amino acid transport system substrate-binding protein
VASLAVWAACGADSRPQVAVFGVSPHVLTLVREALGPDSSRVELIDLNPSGRLAEIPQAEQLVRQREVVAVVGHPDSRTTLMVAPVYREGRLAHIVPTATSRQLAQVGPLTFRMVADNGVQGRLIAEFAVGRLGARTASIFFNPDEYGADLRAVVVSELRRLGVGVLDEVPHRGPGCDPGSPSPGAMQQARASLRRGVPDVVVLAVSPGEAACIIREGESAARGLRYVASDRAAGGGLDWVRSAEVYAVEFRTPGADSAALDFARRYRDRAGAAPSPGSEIYYDAVLLAARAVIGAGLSRRGVARYLSELGRSRPAFQGITGPIHFQAGRQTYAIVPAGPAGTGRAR